MSYKVAFASTDGKVVNEHFGRARQFHIVEIDDKDYKVIESRENIPPCNDFQHTEDGIINSIKLIEDCKAVFIARIGQGALNEVEASGIQAIGAPYFIEDIIDNLINSKVKLFDERE